MMLRKITTVFCFCSVLFSVRSVYGQILYDPTHVHAQPGKFYHHELLTTLQLQFYNPNYHTILKSWKENYIESTLPAQFDYGGIHFDSVGVKYKGNSTFSVPNTFGNQKLPYNIDINEYVSGQQIQGFKKLKLGNCWFDPTFAKEVVSSYIYKQYLPCYENNLIRLVVNGNYLGVYVNQEDVGPQFLKKHFGEKDGAFFKCEPMTEEQAGHPVDWPDLLWRGPDTLDYYESYERKSASGWTEFLEMIYTLNYDPSNIETVVNVDRVLWNFAVTQVLSNEDTYNTTIIHNYYMYQTADGKFQMMPWDLTESFCGILFSGGTPESHYELDPLYGLSPYFADRPLVFQILSDPYYRKRYFAHIRTVMEEFYSVSWIKNWILDLQSSANTAVETDPNKPHNMTKFVENVDTPVNYLLFYTIAGITDVISHRLVYLNSYPDLIYAEPEIVSVTQNIQHPSSTETVYVSAQVNNTNTVKLKVTNNDAPYASDFIAIDMLDNGSGGDAFAGDGIYTAAVPFTNSNDHIKYYIEAENTNALSLMPKRAEYFYYHYYVDQVVEMKEITSLDFSVYPNPASDWLNVSVDSQELFDLRIYNLTGEILYQEINLSGAQKIDIGEFAAGSYLVELSNQEFTKTEKLIIN